MSDYLDALYARELVSVGGHELEVSCSGSLVTTRPMFLAVGPMFLAMNDAEAIALGNALIRLAHHRQAVLAVEASAEHSDQAVQS